MHFQHNHLKEIICFLMSSMVEKKKIEDILSVEILLRGKGGSGCSLNFGEHRLLGASV